MSWQADVLNGIGAPVTATGVRALTLWAGSEGMPAWENNWLATTEPGFTGTPINATGVRAYPTEPKGVAATVATLDGLSYAAVVDAFKNGGQLVSVWSAVNSSPWCSGCQSGHYPVQLWQAAQSTTGVTLTTSVASVSVSPTSVTAHQAWEQLRWFGSTGLKDIVIGWEWITAAIDLA